jgi:hypothetical protein
MRQLTAIFAIVSTALLGLSCGGSGPTLVSPHSVTIEGRIVDAITGQPVSGAIVEAGDQRATTDAQGRYRLINVPPGTTQLVITPPEGWSLAGNTDAVEIELGSNEIGNIYLVPDTERPPSPPGSTGG